MSNKQKIREMVQMAHESPEGFAELYTYYMPRIYSYVAVRVGNRQDAEDITSYTFEKVLKSLGRFDEGKASFTTWLYAIANNNIIDHFRAAGKSRARTTDLEEVECLGTDEQDMANIEWYQAVMGCIRKLPESQQPPLVLKFVLGLSNDEILDITGLSEGALSMRLLRALRSLKKIAEREKLIVGIAKGDTDAVL